MSKYGKRANCRRLVKPKIKQQKKQKKEKALKQLQTIKLEFSSIKEKERFSPFLMAGFKEQGLEKYFYLREISSWREMYFVTKGKNPFVAENYLKISEEMVVSLGASNDVMVADEFYVYVKLYERKGKKHLHLFINPNREQLQRFSSLYGNVEDLFLPNYIIEEEYWERKKKHEGDDNKEIRRKVASAYGEAEDNGYYGEE